MKPAPKVCAFADPPCSRDAVRDGRCENHQRRPWADSTHRKLPDRVRRQVRRRDRFCVFCADPGREVDHRLPQAWGGPDELENLQFMCSNCHLIKTMEERVIGGRGRDPAEIEAHVERWTP